MRYFQLFLAVCFSTFNLFAQDETIRELSKAIKPEKIKSDSLDAWNVNFSGSLNAAQASFRDWAAGGQNSVALAGRIDFNTLYLKEKISWRNGINLAYGQSKIQNIPLRKTDDNIEVFSNVGYQLASEKTSVSFISTFRTQFDRGFNFPNDSVVISKFMAPGYLTANLGFAYVPDENFNLIIAPLAMKFTFVRDQVLADQGAFGVRKAVVDDNGIVIDPGRQFRSEFGAYVKVLFNRQLMENISLKTRFEFFSNYLNNPQNIDVIGEILLTMKVNKWFSAGVAVNMLYDDDINVDYDSTGDGVKNAVGPRLQYKQVISVGVGYTFRNKKEEEKK